MLKNPWVNLVIGLMAGLVVGYMLAEMQPVPPAKALQPAQGSAVAEEGELPPGHPPLDEGGSGAPRDEALESQAAQLLGALAEQPGDSRIMVSLGNLYFDARSWEQARRWYEEALATGLEHPDVTTDLAVVYRSLGMHEMALGALDKALGLRPDHWQALYNKVIVLHFDLHRHDEAKRVLARLKEVKASNPEIPDLADLERDVHSEH